MNYQRIYNELVHRGVIRRRLEGYCEVHHIIPKCLGGEDNHSNLVVLTAREHYIAHWLLTKIHPMNYKVHFAFSLMDGSLSPRGSRNFTSVQYERCKKVRGKAMSLAYTSGERISHMKKDKFRKMASDNIKGDKNPTRRFPEKNRTAYPVTVVFEDGTALWFEYGKQAATELSIPYSTWKYASLHNKGIPSRNIVKIIKHHKSSYQAELNKRSGDSQRKTKAVSCEG